MLTIFITNFLNAATFLELFYEQEIVWHWIIVLMISWIIVMWLIIITALSDPGIVPK